MREQIMQFIQYLESSNPVYGIPLVIIGLVLMFMGFQLHRVAVPFIFVLAGLMIGAFWFGSMTMILLVGGGIGVVLAMISYFTRSYAVAVLSGLAAAFGAGTYASILKQIPQPRLVSLVAAAFGFVAGCSMSYIMYRESVCLLTAFVGSLFVLCGLSAILPASIPSLYQTLSAFLADWPLLTLPFTVGAPTFIGFMVQLGAANRTEMGAE